jgi:hypothetical protein
MRGFSVLLRCSRKSRTIFVRQPRESEICIGAAEHGLAHCPTSLSERMASVAAAPSLARDVRRYRAYFPELRLLAPEAASGQGPTYVVILYCNVTESQKRQT